MVLDIPSSMPSQDAWFRFANALYGGLKFDQRRNRFQPEYRRKAEVGLQGLLSRVQPLCR